MSTIIGIDPGTKGAICLIGDDVFKVFDTPTLTIKINRTNRKVVDINALCGLFLSLNNDHYVDHVFIEKVHAVKGNGVVASFSLGYAYGVINSMIHEYNWPHTLVTPQTWRKAMKVPKGKDGSRLRASQLLPKAAHLWKAKNKHDRAEAALIALYGRKVHV